MWSLPKLAYLISGCPTKLWSINFTYMHIPKTPAYKLHLFAQNFHIKSGMWLICKNIWKSCRKKIIYSTFLISIWQKKDLWRVETAMEGTFQPLYHCCDKHSCYYPVSLEADDAPSHDKLFKICPLLGHLCEKFGEVYTPSCKIPTDESLLLWKGHLAFKQCIPLKRARFGIKCFTLCKDSGYTNSTVQK